MSTQSICNSSTASSFKDIILPTIQAVLAITTVALAIITALAACEIGLMNVVSSYAWAFGAGAAISAIGIAICQCLKSCCGQTEEERLDARLKEILAKSAVKRDLADAKKQLEKDKARLAELRSQRDQKNEPIESGKQQRILLIEGHKKRILGLSRLIENHQRKQIEADDYLNGDKTLQAAAKYLFVPVSIDPDLLIRAERRAKIVKNNAETAIHSAKLQIETFEKQHRQSLAANEEIIGAEAAAEIDKQMLTVLAELESVVL